MYLICFRLCKRPDINVTCHFLIIFFPPIHLIIMNRILSFLALISYCVAASVKIEAKFNRPYRVKHTNLNLKAKKTFFDQVEIQPSALSHWGDWGEKAFCPDNSWAQGFQLKVRRVIYRKVITKNLRWRVTREAWTMTPL